MSLWQRLRGAVRSEWSFLSGLGRITSFALIVSLVIAVVLGFVIPAAVERNLINARIDSLTGVADDLADRGLLFSLDGFGGDIQDLDEAVRLRLIGGDVVRVKLWDENGTILYSDATEIIGMTFPRSEDQIEAFEGTAQSGIAELDRLENTADQGFGELREFYLPVVESGRTVALFEVYEKTGAIRDAVSSTRLWVWLSIGTGLSVLLLFVLSLAGSTLRVVDSRRKQAERLYADLSVAQEEERSRVMGALHDDIGQPLYRVLYGIQGCRSQVDPVSRVALELDRAAELVRSIDGTLRSELLMLHQGAIDEFNLDTLLGHLVDDVRSETELEIILDVGDHDELSIAGRAALFRSAREAITNARKHSGATLVTITVTDGSHRLILDVEDNGSGFEAEIGLGLATTQDRLEAIGGGLQVVPRDGGGTLFRAWVPTAAGAET